MFDGQNEYTIHNYGYLFQLLLNADWTARVKKSINFPCGEMWGMKRNGKKIKMYDGDWRLNLHSNNNRFQECACNAN